MVQAKINLHNVHGRTALSFEILRATNIYIRGSRGLKRVIPTEDIDYTVINNENCVERLMFKL